jgi:two-component system NarL family sensor kinase
MKKIFLFIFLSVGVSVFPQDGFTDSLKNLLLTAKEDTSKVFLFTDIADELTGVDFKKSLDYCNKGLALAEKLNFKKGIAQAYSTMANAYSDQSDYTHCLECNLKALELRKELNLSHEIAASLDNIGNVYNDQGNFTKALEYYYQCVEIDTKNNDKKGLALLYNNIGNAYANKGDLKQSITYLFKSLKLKEVLGNKKGAANTCNNLAVIYKMQGNYPEALRYNEQAMKFRIDLKDSMGIAFSYTNLGLTYRNLNKDDKAEENFLQALSIFTRLGYKKGIAAANNSLGIIYKTRRQYEKALTSYKTALQIFNELNDKMGKATAMSNLASVYGKNKNNADAENYFKQAEILATEAKSFEVLMDVYDLYSVYYEENTDFKNALKYHLLYTTARDSLRSKENSNALAEVKTRYETDIKEKENDNLKDENKIKDLTITQKNTQRNIFIILFGSVIIIGFLLYSRFKLKEREELNKQLIAQQELRSKAIIEAEEKERTRIARELHDGIGQQLSAAKLNISGLQASLNTNNAEEKTMLQNAIDLIDESVKEVRVVSHSMMPNALLKSGLVSAVKEFINKISSTGSLKINLEIVGLSARLEQTVETVLFRVLQELVNNIIKHAKASEVSIQLIRHEKELTILIEDNGVGFDVDKVSDKEGGIGLKNIQSRVAFLNGQVYFDSHLKKGTTVTIEIPA